LRKLPFFLLFAFSLAASADEQPYLVRDLPGVAVHDSMPFGRTFWTTIGNSTWFIANTTGKAIDVFKSDGTTDGTVQVTHGFGVPESQFLAPFLGVVHGNSFTAASTLAVKGALGDRHSIARRRAAYP
jgi:hypothetical protein